MRDNESEKKRSASLNLAEPQDEESSEQACRVCGCTWYNACPGGCYWVENDLCSECCLC